MFGCRDFSGGCAKNVGIFNLFAGNGHSNPVFIRFVWFNITNEAREKDFFAVWDAANGNEDKRVGKFGGAIAL